MPTITAIEKQKRRPRFDVYLDGSLSLNLRLDLLAISRLAVGDELSRPRIKELEAEDQRLSAIEAALRLLSLGPRSEREVRDRLKRRGLRGEAIDAAVQRVRELGYIDDAAFARFFVESRQAATPKSRRALAFELGRKGVARELVSESVSELSDVEAAYAAAQRRLRSLSKLDRQAFTRRLGSFLASRGFGYGIARQTIDRCWQELSGEGAGYEEEEPAGISWSG
jgi:regulatory protein